MARREISRYQIFLFAIFFVAAFLIEPCYAARHSIGDERVIVWFDEPLKSSAMEVLKAYPSVRLDLKKDLGWKSDFRPEIVLIKESASFRRFAGSDLVTALAIPQKDLILIDSSRMNVYPFTLVTTLKHELCHLELHHHISESNLPRWLDEGVCQWVTGGLSEVMSEGDSSIMKEAAFSNRLISIKGLTERFPDDGRELILAYQESRSIVEYIKMKFGVSAVRSILDHMGQGDNLENAVRKSLMISLDELEKRWRSYVIGKASWLAYMGDNLYEILFMFAAVITICGFIRIIIRKKVKDKEDQGEEL